MGHFSQSLDRNKNCCSPAAPAPADPLSARRELVEQLESDPVLPYLEQNGVLAAGQADQIRGEASPAKVNLALLRHLEEHGSGVAAQKLFVNALRQSGQLQLANLLDDSDRIRALSASGYLGKSRRKGQVHLEVKVKALRLPRDSLPNTPVKSASTTKTSASPPPVAGPARREWVSLDDIQLRILQLSQPPPPVTKDTQVTVAEKKRSSCCLCSCFSRLFSRNKKDKSVTMTTITTTGQTDVIRSSSFSNVTMTTVNRQQPEPDDKRKLGGSGEKYKLSESSPHIAGRRDSKGEQLEKLRNLAEIMQSKALHFYELLQDSSSETHQNLLKYFEQDRGTLVLESQVRETLVVVNICMTRSHLNKLRTDISSGRLTRDVEGFLEMTEVYERTGASGVKLEITVDEDELELAESELTK